MQKMLVASLMLFSVGAAQAQDVGNTPSSSGLAPNDAVGVHLAPGLRGTASVGFSTIYNSNYYLTQSDAKPSFGLVLTPNVLFQREMDKVKYEVGAGLEGVKYTDINQGPTGYLDAMVNGKFDWAALTRHNFSFDYNTRFGHDPFGSERTELGIPLNQGLDKWIQTGVSGRYRFGAPGALINLETEAGWTGRSYKTNRTETAYLDFRTWNVGETAFFNVSSKTAFLAEVIHSDTTYNTEVSGFPSRDYKSMQYLVGMHWLATGATSGDVRVGRVNYTFDNSAQSPFSSLDWNAKIKWAPLVYSTFTIQTGEQSQASYLANVQFLQNRYGLIDWTHEFSYQLRSRVSYSHVNTTFIGAPDNRVDRLDTFALEANYLLTPRWTGTAGTSYSRRNSTEDGRNYGDTSVYIGIRYNR